MIDPLAEALRDAAHADTLVRDDMVILDPYAENAHAIRAALPDDAAFVTVEGLAAALGRLGGAWDEMCDDTSPTSNAEFADAIVKALKEAERE